MEDGEGGKKPAGEGWFIVNTRDAAWMHNDKFGAGATFEGTPYFQHYGINVQVLWPGQPNGYYHSDDGQEDFLILSGEGLLLVEGEERPVRAWDFVHFPPETEHILVGSGDGPCVFLAVGARVGLELPLGGILSAGAHADVLAPVTETVLRISGQPVWTSPAISGALGVTMGARFP
jgi:quercetin dioxygenase-like cupin family protein